MSEVNNRLEGLIRGLRPCRVAVIGDVMLDHYVRGNADRLSPQGQRSLSVSGGKDL